MISMLRSNTDVAPTLIDHCRLFTAAESLLWKVVLPGLSLCALGSPQGSTCILSICAHIRCICGLLKNKCRILVTHQLQHLRAADHILLLQEVSYLSTQNRFGLYRCLTSLSLRVVS